jgi:hypothetical protein
VRRQSLRVRLAAASRRLAALPLVALICVSCGGGAHHPAANVPAGATETHPPHLVAGTLVLAPHAAAGPVAADARDLVWESGPIESDQFQPTLHDRDLSTGTTRTLSSNVDPLFGLASTSGFVFYARSTGNSTSLVRVSHAGTQTRVLTHSLATPIASRGNVVAWGEQSGAAERVVAYSGARRWIVAEMRRCTTGGCYRLGGVTVAKDGIVFTRDAVGSQPSIVMRSAFGSNGLQSVVVRHDPQPDLVPSSSGALYYVLSRGWYRWDFGSAAPRPVTFANSPLKQLIRHEGSRWYWLVRQGCGVRLESSRGGKAAALAVPKRLVHVPRYLGRPCTQLGALTVAGTDVIASWAIAAAIAEDAHDDMGLHGVVVDARIPARS